jgi:4'-phosphopantetheinyl transferase EntD
MRQPLFKRLLGPHIETEEVDPHSVEGGLLKAEEEAVPGFVGSISHTDTWCAAAVARAEDVRSIGIDLEPATPLKESLWRRVCTPKERDWLHELSAPELTGKILFSAKEAVYKCQYPITTKFLGFHAVEVEIDEGEFRAVFQQEAGEFQPGDVMLGRYLVEEGLVATACELPR